MDPTAPYGAPLPYKVLLQFKGKQKVSEQVREHFKRLGSTQVQTYGRGNLLDPMVPGSFVKFRRDSGFAAGGHLNDFEVDQVDQVRSGTMYLS